MKETKRLSYIYPKRETARRVLAVLFWLLAAACAACIFWLSSRDATDSQNMSDSFRGLFEKLFGWLPGSFLIRKFAHFFEYAGLGFLLNCALFLTRRRISPIISLICCVLYSVSDEVHQYFVPGRACRIFDVGVDTAGAAAGILAFLLILLTVNSIAARCLEKSYS